MRNNLGGSGRSRGFGNVRAAGNRGVDATLVLVSAGATLVFGAGAEELAWVNEGGERHFGEKLRKCSIRVKRGFGLMPRISRRSSARETSCYVKRFTSDSECPCLFKQDEGES